MIVVDTSAVVAIFRREDDASLFAERIGRDPTPLVSAASVLEISMVLRGLKAIPAEESESWLDLFLEAGGFTVEPVNLSQLSLARAAHHKFGKGSGHPAALNYGDCFSYALAKARQSPLLFKGSDFARTDVAVA